VKLLALAAVILPLCIVSSLTTAQGPQSAELKHLMAAPLNGSRPVSMAATSIERGTQYPTVVRLKGSVEIKTPVCLPTGKNGALVCDGEMIVQADEAEFHEDTGEIRAHGNVEITPLRHR
jgi:lipopolysaccharide assembly outer membrane protein LptD (OstA)